MMPMQIPYEAIALDDWLPTGTSTNMTCGRISSTSLKTDVLSSEARSRSLLFCLTCFDDDATGEKMPTVPIMGRPPLVEYSPEAKPQLVSEGSIPSTFSFTDAYPKRLSVGLPLPPVPVLPAALALVVPAPPVDLSRISPVHFAFHLSRNFGSSTPARISAKVRLSR